MMQSKVGAPDVQTLGARVRPASAAGRLTGFAGLAAAVLAVLAVHSAEFSAASKAAVVVLASAACMIAVDVVIYRKLAPSRSSDPTEWRRVGIKLAGFYSIIAIIVACYWLLPVYTGDAYAAAFEIGKYALPVVAIVAIPYFAIVDRRMEDPQDAYYDLGRFLTGKPPAQWAGVHGLLRGWLVKGFFLPLMFGFVASDLNQVWTLATWPQFASFQDVFSRTYDGLFLIDVLIATVGYLTTIKLLDTHIRSTEPTMLGWVVCIVCYPPFWDAIGLRYLSYDQDNVYWGAVFWGTPALYIAWGSAILLLVAIYVWSTLAFGLRFSNLTHRGIITHGPYRWTKHPAYISKNITWWLISIPLFPGTGDIGMAIRSSVLLAGINVLYYLRARTEERHLSADPVYVQYSAFIAHDGLLARLRRLFRRPATAG